MMQISIKLKKIMNSQKYQKRVNFDWENTLLKKS